MEQNFNFAHSSMQRIDQLKPLSRVTETENEKINTEKSSARIPHQN